MTVERSKRRCFLALTFIVLSLDLKIFKLGEDLTSKGKEFHKKGAATVKVLKP